MVYKHGVYVEENPTTFEQPGESTSTTIVAFGTAPINLADDPNSVVNSPQIVRTFEEAKNLFGYSDDWEKYTLSEVMDAAFKQVKSAPLVLVNVLDPNEHTTSVTSEEITAINSQATINTEGIVLDSVVLKSQDGTTTYTIDEDYLLAFDDEGFVSVSVLDGGQITVSETLTVDYDKLDPSLVTNDDIIGGYDETTNTFKGIETVSTIFPKLNVVPSLLIAPGFSHNQEIGAALVAKSEAINGSFKTENVLDLEGNTIDSAILDKETKLYDDKSSVLAWPKIKISDKTYRYSSILASVMQRTDVENDNVPYQSPSNKRISISSLVNDDGQEIYLDQVQGNRLNGKGIVTAINMRGWRVWGNNTAMYDDENLSNVPDPKDRFIAVRRMFNWWGNSFILNYFDRVDDPTSYRLIESVVDQENIRANGFKARGQIAGAKIEFREKDNPVHQIMDGKIQFIQKIGFLTPAKEIENVIEFDPTILTESLFGGDA